MQKINIMKLNTDLPKIDFLNKYIIVLINQYLKMYTKIDILSSFFLCYYQGNNFP